jgi:hypothetical protein
MWLASFEAPIAAVFMPTGSFFWGVFTGGPISLTRLIALPGLLGQYFATRFLKLARLYIIDLRFSLKKLLMFILDVSRIGAVHEYRNQKR